MQNEKYTLAEIVLGTIISLLAIYILIVSFLLSTSS